MPGLYAGTFYTCTLASENGAGGFDDGREAVFHMTYDAVSTQPDYSDVVTPASMTCAGLDVTSHVTSHVTSRVTTRTW